MLDKLPEECLLIILNLLPEPKYKSHYIPRFYMNVSTGSMIYYKNTNCNFVMYHLLNLSRVCKSFYTLFQSNSMWCQLAVRDIRKGSIYKRPPKNMQKKYIQKFVYPKALHEFSRKVRKLEMERYHYIINCCTKQYIREQVLYSISDKSKNASLHKIWYVTEDESDHPLIELHRKYYISDTFQIQRRWLSCKQSIRVSLKYSEITNTTSFSQLPCVKLLLGVMNYLQKKTKFIEKEVNRIDRLYQETDVTKFSVDMNNGRKIGYHFY